MGNRSSKYWLIGLIIVLIAGLAAVMIWSYSYVNWSESYEEENDLPYGTSVLKKLVELQVGARLQTLPDSMAPILEDHHHLDKIHNYMYIGRHLHLDSAELNSLLEFVDHGNQAFIMSYNFNPALLDSLFTISNSYEDWYYDELELAPNGGEVFYEYSDTSVFCRMYFKQVHEGLPFECKFVRQHEPIIKPWPYFNPNLETKDGRGLEPLGYFNDQEMNFAAVPYGEGIFYLHTTPIAFTNYTLLQKPAFEYTNYLLGLLGTGDVLWDTKGREFTPSSSQGNSGSRSNRGGTDYGHSEGPLAFILTEPAFKWAWYVLIATTALYFAFGARRKQKVIPVIQTPENSSLEFAETIGHMYRAQHDHRNIVNLKFNLFLQFVRERYGIRTSSSTTDHTPHLIKRISVVSDIPEEHIQAIFDQYKALQISMEVSNDQLIQFYQLVEHFHLNCK